MVNKITVQKEALSNLEGLVVHQKYFQENEKLRLLDKGENKMEKLKAKEIVERGISDMRRSVEDCNLDVLDRILLVSDETRRGLHSDKSINREEYSIYNRQLNELINKFQKNCHCSKKQIYLT